jgi:GNAT superfamily N-acetyltransferase
MTCTRNGGAFLFRFRNMDIAVAIVNPKLNCLLVLNVEPTHRGHGIGGAILRYLQCNFARVLESAVPFFQRNGYTSRGKMKTGKRLKTQVMVKSSLLTLAGRVSQIFEVNKIASRPPDIQADR